MTAAPRQHGPQGDDSRLGARELARAKRDALARRARRIRTWVAAATVSMFLAAFLVVYVQMASGHDPALAASAERRSSGASGSTSSSGSSSGEGSETESGVEEASGSSAAESGSSSTETGSPTESGSESSGSGESGSSSASESESSGPSGLTTSQS